MSDESPFGDFTQQQQGSPYVEDGADEPIALPPPSEHTDSHDRCSRGRIEKDMTERKRTNERRNGQERWAEAGDQIRRAAECRCSLAHTPLRSCVYLLLLFVCSFQW